jgi:hypothetical protein
LVVAGGVAAGVAALVALREVAGDIAARTAAPFMVLLPAAIWWSSADAFYAGISALSVTSVVLATGRIGRRADMYAFAGGVGFGLAAFLSYGLVPLALIPVVVAADRRRMRPLAVAGVGALVVFFAFASLGFWWFAGLTATRHQYLIGAAASRPYLYFLVGNLALFAVATGPAVAIGLARLRDRSAWLLVGTILGVIAIADVSGMSKAEVERIWLPFVPWAALATAGLVDGMSFRMARRCLALQACCALVLATTVWSIW